MNPLNPVQQHYTVEDLPARVKASLEDAGLGEGLIEWSRLAPVDQFHARGMEATKELAQALGLAGRETVLDVGSGFGGPARFLAATLGCNVTGIDLTTAYIEVAQILARRTGLSDRLTFVQGDALDLPFPSDSYDAAWIMHVGMNIADKERLYSGIYRVLKPGGRLAVYDIVKGNDEPLLFPLPWARDPATSFVVTEETLLENLHTAGFRDISVTDRTSAMLEWVAGLQATQGPNPLLAPAGPGTFNLVAMVLESGGKEINGNFIRNIAEGRARLMQIIAQKD